MIPRPENPIVAALDVSDASEAERLAGLLAPHVGMLKVGFELFWAHGPAAVRQAATHAPVFLDAKLHDIPNTVERASANIARLGVRMFNVHALGGEAMMRAALDGAKRGADAAGVPVPLVIAVTVLSSQSGEGLASPASLAWEARQAGLDGVVVSGEDVRDVRDVCGDAFCLAVPGIRPSGANGDDQVRVLTPRAAIERGADYLLIGRPIIEATDPVGVVRGILRDIA
jgi:orotidine-5'-phosphate decarboxylase